MLKIKAKPFSFIKDMFYCLKGGEDILLRSVIEIIKIIISFKKHLGLKKEKKIEDKIYQAIKNGSMLYTYEIIRDAKLKVEPVVVNRIAKSLTRKYPDEIKHIPVDNRNADNEMWRYLY